MIDLIDEALETFLRDQASIDSTIGLSFDAPNAEWTAALTGPAINVFLWLDLRHTNDLYLNAF